MRYKILCINNIDFKQIEDRLNTGDLTDFEIVEVSWNGQGAVIVLKVKEEE